MEIDLVIFHLWRYLSWYLLVSLGFSSILRLSCQPASLLALEQGAYILGSGLVKGDNRASRACTLLLVRDSLLTLLGLLQPFLKLVYLNTH